MYAKDVMTRDVATVTPEATVRDAIARMMRRRIGGMPVVDAATRALVGIVTLGDLLERGAAYVGAARHPWLERLVAATGRTQGAQGKGRTVADVMTRRVVTIDADMPLAQVVATMQRNAVRRLPVVAQGRVVGIVARDDLVRSLARSLRTPAAGQGPVARKPIVDEMD